MPDYRADRLQEVVNKAVGSPGQAASRLPTIIAILTAVVIALFIVIKIIFSRRKVEKMMSKMRIADEAKIQALEDENLAEYEEERTAAQEKVMALEEEIFSLKDQIQKRRCDHMRLVTNLRSVVNWDDLRVIDAREDS